TDATISAGEQILHENGPFQWENNGQKPRPWYGAQVRVSRETAAFPQPVRGPSKARQRPF
ncbi:MAG: hypothetical protein OXI19_16385, partial [Gemmatimonadota bacterium]|nr:hypothetical protein [Gemmatimonadota bacterium]